MNPNISKSVLERIKKDDIKPRSRGYYALRYGSFWVLFALMLVIGALSFAVMLFAVQHTDFAIFDYVDNGGWQQILTLMPFVWVLAIGIAIGLGVWGLKHTKRGYRLAILGVFGGNVLGSALLGSIVYGIGGGEIIEEIIEENVPVYESVREKHEKFWGNPEKTGRLAGMVESIDEEAGTVTVQGPRGQSWEIPQTRLQKFGMEIEVGEPIKMRGTPEGERGFLPEILKKDPKHKRINKRIRDRFEQNPQLRRELESRLSPATQETLQEARESGEKPTPELKQRILDEIKETITPPERERLKEDAPRIMQERTREQFREPIQERVQTRREAARTQVRQAPTRTQNPPQRPVDSTR